MTLLGSRLPRIRSAAALPALLVMLLAAGCTVSTTPDAAYLDSIDARAADRMIQPLRAAELLTADVREPIAGGKGVLERDEAVARSLRRNLSLIASAENLTLAQAALAQAGLWQNPTISQTGAFLVPVSPSSGAVAFDFMISQQVNTFLSRDSRVAQAEAQRIQAGIDLASAAFDTGMRARAKFNEVAHNERSRRLAERVAAVYRRAADAAVARAKVGLVAIPEVNRARLQAADAERQVRRLALQRDRAAQELQSLMGDSGRPEWALPPAWLAPPTTLVQPPDADDAETLALGLRLDVERADLDRRVADEGVRQARINLFPLLTIGFDGGRGGDTSVVLGPSVAFTLPIFDPGVVAVRAAEDQQRKADKTYVAAAQQAGQDARSATDSLRLAVDDVLFYRDEFIPQQIENVKIAEQSFEIGNTDLDSLLNTLRDYAAAEQSLEDSIAAYEDALIGLNRAIGATFDQMPDGASAKGILAAAEVRKNLAWAGPRAAEESADRRENVRSEKP